MADFQTILASDFAFQIVYPFLLIFVLLFAILQKSKILGEGKSQIDAMVSLVIALIVVSVGWATDIITKMMPFLAVTVVVLLIFLIIFGFVASGKDGFEIPNNIKIGTGILAAIVVIVALLVATGQWDKVYSSFLEGGKLSNVWSNIILLLIVIAAMAVVLFSGRKKKKKED